MSIAWRGVHGGAHSDAAARSFTKAEKRRLRPYRRAALGALGLRSVRVRWYAAPSASSSRWCSEATSAFRYGLIVSSLVGLTWIRLRVRPGSPHREIA